MMLDLGLIEKKKNGRLCLNDRHITAGNQKINHLALHNFNIDMMKNAQDSYTEQLLDKRDISGA